MLRDLLTLVVPLVLPTVLYLVWLQAMRWSEQRAARLSWRAMPWVWLAATGVVLAALVLFVVTVHYGTATPGRLRGRRMSRTGEIVPGHIDPQQSAVSRLDPPWLHEPAMQRLLAALTAAGIEARFVGGCVRDALLGH